MENKIYAVITGDLVDSTGIEANYKNALNDIANNIRQYQLPNFIFDVYRGDSFQALVSEPGKALLISMIIRTGLRRNTRGVGLENIWDARISIGLGTIKNIEISQDKSISSLDGEAFLRSGRMLDTMKKEGALLKITTGNDQLNKEFVAICPLVDTIIGRWSTAQAEALYLYLLRNLTQKEIGKLLNASQRAIGKRLEASHIENLKPFIARFKEVSSWK